VAIGNGLLSETRIEEASQADSAIGSFRAQRSISGPLARRFDQAAAVLACDPTSFGWQEALELSPVASVGFLRASKDEDYAQIDNENGNGPIHEEVTPSIFEPSYTTKSPGTGLGLAIAHNISRQHFASLQLTANTPERVRFSLTLPRVAVWQETSRVSIWAEF
jgi:hypothetical protein